MAEYKKTEIFWASTASIEASRPAMKALAVLASKFGMDAVYSRLVDGDYATIADWMVDCHKYTGPDTVSELEDEIMESGLFNIEAQRYGNRYRLVPDGDDIWYQYVEGVNGEGGLRLDVRDAIKEEIESSDAFVYGKPLMQNLYNKLCAECKSGRYKAAYDLRFTDDTAAKPAGAPASTGEVEVVEKEVVRERIIERETEPVLEKMMREAMVNVMVNMNVDDITATVKKKVIDEYGFEPQRHIVKIADVERPVDEIVHHEFDTVLHYIANDIPTYLYGAGGSGKNVLCEQVAKALGMDYYFMNSVTDEFKISGFIDAYGSYHETPFYKAFKNGGLFFLDELDASAPEVLVCLNAAIANRYFSFPNGQCQAHPDFRVVAAGNTLGTGADASYTGRMQLDAASLNRFVIVEIDYDENIDRYCAGGDEEMVKFFRAIRDSFKECGLSILASYRNISQLRIAKEAMPLEKALSQCLCKEMNQDDINITFERMRPLAGNQYYDAFKNVKAIVG